MPELTNSQNPSSAPKSEGEPRGGELHTLDSESAQPDKANHADQLAQISALLRQGLDPESEEAAGDADDADTIEFDSEPSSKPKLKPPKTLKELSEATGLSEEDLYKMAVPDGSEEGKSYSLSELKDAATKLNGVELRELELEERASTREASLNRMQSEIEELFKLIPEKFRTPELVEQISSKREATILRERQKALQVIPEWNDQTTREKEIGGIIEHLADYGLPPSYLQGVADHRLLRYIRENWRRHDRVTKALAMVNEKFPRTPGSKPNPKGKTAPKETSSRSTQQQVRAISNLLRNGD